MDKNLEKDDINYFKRILIVTIVGILFAVSVKNIAIVSVGFAFQGIPIIMRFTKYDIKRIFLSFFVLAFGAFLGLFIGEIAWAYRLTANIAVYILFVFILNCLAHRYYSPYCTDFMATFCYFSVFASYLNKNLDLGFIQYIGQLVIMFLIVTISFIVFPGYRENKEVEFTIIPMMNTLDTLVNAFIVLIFWNFYMLFEWTFAIFAIISVWGLYSDNPHCNMIESIKSTIKATYYGCIVTSVLSLILFAKAGNYLVLTLFLIAILGYLLEKARKGTMLERKKYMGYYMSTAIPISLYISNYTAVLHDSYLRAITISELFLFQFIIIKILGAITRAKMKVDC